MNEINLDKELHEVLTMLRAIELKMVDGTMQFDKDIFAIHLAVLQGCYDMSEALEFIRCMYESEE